MFFNNEYIAKEIMDMHTEMIAKEVAKSVPFHPGLRKQTQTSRRMAWLTWQACRVLATLGCRLVAMGKRLEQYSQSPLSPQEG